MTTCGPLFSICYSSVACPAHFIIFAGGARHISEYLLGTAGTYEIYAIYNEHNDEDRFGGDGDTNHE